MLNTIRRLPWGIILIGSILLIVIYSFFGMGHMWRVSSNSDQKNWPDEFQSNGERIYFTGTSEYGFPINITGGGMHMEMHVGGCVTCHGADRTGGRIMPRFWVIAPPLTSEALFDEHDKGGDEGRGGHGDHERYDDDSLQRAIKDGVNPDGKQLDEGMPRWTMSKRDMSDLIQFLKSPVQVHEQ